MKMDLKKSGKTLGKATASGGGVVLGSFGMSMIPDTVPSIGKGVIAIALGLGVALASSNAFIQSAAHGITASGALKVVKEATEGQTGLIAEFNSAIPTLGNPEEQYYLPEDTDFNQVDENLCGIETEVSDYLLA